MAHECALDIHWEHGCMVHLDFACFNFSFVLFFSFPSAFLFFLIGGNAGTTTKGAEIHNYNKHFLIFTNDFTGHEDYTTNGHLTVESKEKVISDHTTIYISYERVEVTNYRGYQAVYDSRYLFQLSERLIATPPSTATDIWLSWNRVIRNSYRRGTGLCKVAISWV